MKKTFTTILMLSGVAVASAQTFSDNFDSYTLGDYIGVQSSDWTTWSGTTGGTEDAQTVDAQASSAPHSIHFTSTSANGGPQDVVLPFGGEHSLGIFDYEMDMYIVGGAYFNFQANQTIGQTWALDVTFNGDGTYTCGPISGTYTQNQWVTVKVSANLTTNAWELFFDGNSEGTWSNPTNQVASLDLFPLENHDFYVDNVSYNLTPYTLPQVNGSVNGIAAVNGLSGQSKNVTATIRNLGIDAITSYDVTYDYNGNQVTENVTGVNITSTNSEDYTFTAPITLVSGSNPLVVTISNVNGAGPDGDSADDSQTVTVDPVVPAPGKMVVGEEATGTWCGWCTRGIVFMDQMAADYDGYWAGIAVHNGDPMADTDYDSGMGNLIGGYPSSVVDRGADIDPSAMEADFLQRIVLAPNALLTNGATFDGSTIELSVSADWQAAQTGDWRIAAVVVEDGVTGTGSGWEQANYYSGGGSGVMGGYENLGNPIPAADMVYDHVGRMIAPSFDGMANSFPATIANASTHVVNMSLSLDPSWDTTKIHIVSMLIDPQGRIDNATYTTIAEAVANGYVAGIDGGDYAVESMIVSPNPAEDMAFVNLELNTTSEVELSIIDITGKIIENRNFGYLSGSSQLPVNVSELTSGIYMVQLTIGTEVKTSRLVVK